MNLINKNSHFNSYIYGPLLRMFQKRLVPCSALENCWHLKSTLYQCKCQYKANLAYYCLICAVTGHFSISSVSLVFKSVYAVLWLFSNLQLLFLQTQPCKTLAIISIFPWKMFRWPTLFSSTSSDHSIYDLQCHIYSLHIPLWKRKFYSKRFFPRTSTF